MSACVVAKSHVFGTSTPSLCVFPSGVESVNVVFIIDIHLLKNDEHLNGCANRTPVRIIISINSLSFGISERIFFSMDWIRSESSETDELP